jgi:uncharacterized membrane protein YhhN
MDIVFSGLLAAAAAVHITSLFLGNKTFKAASKVIILPLLLALYCLSAKQFLASVVLALAAGWIGDITLIRISSRKFFQIGLAGFLLGHLAYIFSMLRLTGSGFHIPALVISIAAAIPLGFLIFRFIRPNREMRIPVIIYETVIETMSVCALQLFLYRGDMSAAFVFGGSLCFIVSDTILAYFTFSALPKYGSVFVMVPYIAAQSALVLGLAGMA